VLARPRLAGLATALLASLALLALLAPASAPAAKGGTIRGTVPLRGMNVVLFASTPGANRPVKLGSTRSGRGGSFALRYRASGDEAVKYLVATRPGGAAEAGFPVPGNSYRLAAALGIGEVPRRAAVNERTTVAIGFAMAQFLSGNRMAGENPGLRNSAAMTWNLVGHRRGGVSPVLRRYPNGNSTSAWRTFDSLANLLATCRVQGLRCAALLKLAAAPGSRRAAGDTLAAIGNIARSPWRNVRGLYRLSLATRGTYAPALGPGEMPDAWTLALRFEGGTPRSLDGPGNVAIDKQGFIWVGNNYAYSRDLSRAVGPGKTVMRFTPTGRYASGSPIEAGGTTGVGFGVAIDTRDHVWVANFGFEGRGFEGIPAPHNSVSEYGPYGEPISPALEEHEEKLPDGTVRRFYTGGWEDGEMFWPQDIVSDKSGNMWIANCGNNSVTKYPMGDHNWAVNYPQSQITLLGSEFGFARPFGLATNDAGEVWVTANESRTVAVLDSEGNVVHRIEGGGLHRPLGIASDSRGNMWVGNSTWVVAPCAGEFHPEGGPSKGGSVTLIKANGELAAKSPYRNGGIKNAWGTAVDGNDTVWVANFSGKRLAQLCGMRTRACPPGKRKVGAPISPAGTGYGFDGLERVTGLQVDPSGNVWAVNNWRPVPIQRNPGGFQIVAYLGVAAPIKTPLIGQPEAP
jgi:DNA-binding beta-propeller fold protein YncE